MENTLERIAKALTNDDLPDNTSFYAETELQLTDINIEVEEVGKLAFPINQLDIEKLIAISSKAKFGLREQTILDKNVRDTNEITAYKLRVTVHQSSFDHMLNNIAKTLGVVDDGKLIPHLHNMLIYQPGQFFAKHQDSEKLENMVASLVVILPASHIGGNLIIKHGKKKHIFASENIVSTTIKCVGFYSDCQHEIKKVKQGYRVALTYNLVLQSSGLGISKITRGKPQLIESVKDYFDIEQVEKSSKLVYFLDHSYSEHSLRWDMLKGSDRTNGSAFLAIAEELDLIPHLALVEIRQSFSTNGDEDDPELYEIIDDEVNLSYFVDVNNKQLPYNMCYITSDEICLTKDTEEFEPYNTEFEGYMGNYGNTADYWYRRAAIVLWKKTSQVAMNFMLNYQNAISGLLSLTFGSGNEREVKEFIKQAGKYLYQYQKEQKNCIMLGNIAFYAQDQYLALSILSHFSWEILDTDIAELLVKLQNQYGANWCITLLNVWKNHENRSSNCILNNFSSFVDNFLNYQGETQIVQLLLDTQVIRIIEYDQKQAKWQKPVEINRDLHKRIDRLYQIFVACVAIQDVAILNKMIKHVISNENLYPIISLAELFSCLQPSIPSTHLIHYQSLQDYLVRTINNELDLGRREADDWSIVTKLFCKCEHCNIAKQFLHAKNEINKIWPIVMDIRNHIISEFNSLDLPVDLSVEKKGSPHKLVMVKTARLHQDANKRFDDLKFYQQKL